MSVTVLIQGPLNKVSLSNISQYLKFGKVVVSFWDQDNVQLFKELDSVDFRCTLENPNVKMVSQYMPSQDEWGPDWHPHNRQGTFPWAVKSTYLGLKNIDTKYTIKTRSDEKFENLQPLIDLHMKTKKFVFGSAFARNWHRDRFMVGDHIFMDSTKNLIHIYENIINNHEFRYPKYCAEHILGINCLKSRYEDMDVLKGNVMSHDANVQEKYARKALECIDINLLGDYVISHRGANKVWKKDFDNCSVTPNGVNNTREFFDTECQAKSRTPAVDKPGLPREPFIYIRKRTGPKQ